jgi:hypothetical protein
MTVITPEIVAAKIASYLHHQLTAAELVDWAEHQIMEGEFSSAGPVPAATVRDAVARLGVADVQAFGLNWEDCEQLLRQLGFNAKIEIIAA